MSGLSDALAGIGEWAKRNWEDPGKVSQAAARGIERAPAGLNQWVGGNVVDPFAKWAGIPKGDEWMLFPADPTGIGLFPHHAEQGGGGDGAQLPVDEGEFGGKKYKFSAETLDPSQVQDVYGQGDLKLTGPQEQGPLAPGEHPKNQEQRDLDIMLGGNVDPSKLTDKEYDTLTKEASKGNKLAQQILVKGKYKEQRFPSLGQDLAKFEDPFVKALSGLPEMATNLQGQMNNVTQLYDFKNADNQVNTLLGQMGSSMRATASPETQSYADKIAGVVKAGGNQLTNTTAGLPSIEGALSQLGPAAKLSEKSTPEAALLAALLGHEQSQIVYANAVPSAKGEPNWLQALIQQVTGAASGGGLVDPRIAASGLHLPSTNPAPSTGA